MSFVPRSVAELTSSAWPISHCHVTTPVGGRHHDPFWGVGVGVTGRVVVGVTGRVVVGVTGRVVVGVPGCVVVGASGLVVVVPGCVVVEGCDVVESGVVVVV